MKLSLLEPIIIISFELSLFMCVCFYFLLTISSFNVSGGTLFRNSLLKQKQQSKKE